MADAKIFAKTSGDDASLSEKHFSLPFSKKKYNYYRKYGYVFAIPYLAQSLGSTPEHSLMRIGNLGLFDFSST